MKKNIHLFSDYLPYAVMVARGVILTKDGVLIRTCRISCNDLTFAGNEEIETVYRRLNNSFKLLSDKFTLYIDVIRKKVEEENAVSDDIPLIVKEFETARQETLKTYYKSEIYITFCYVVLRDNKQLRNFIFTNEGGNKKEGSIEDELNTFIKTTDDIFRMYESICYSVNVLNDEQALTYIHTCISNDDHCVVTPECARDLDHYLSDVKFIPDSICKINDEFILTGSIHDFPSETHNDMINILMRINIEYRLTLRFIFMEKEKSKKVISGIRNQFFQKRKKASALIAEAITKVETKLVDTEALQHVSGLDTAIANISSGDIFYGLFTSSLIVRNTDYEKAENDLNLLKKEIQKKGLIVKTETINTPFVYLGSLPGNIHHNVRKPILCTANISHLLPLSEPWQGTLHINGKETNNG